MCGHACLYVFTCVHVCTHVFTCTCVSKCVHTCTVLVCAHTTCVCVLSCLIRAKLVCIHKGCCKAASTVNMHIYCLPVWLELFCGQCKHFMYMYNGTAGYYFSQGLALQFLCPFSVAMPEVEFTQTLMLAYTVLCDCHH